MFTDMLGSVRTITDQYGAVAECYDYLPFGRMLGSGIGGRRTCYPSSPDVNYGSSAPQKFAGKERDAETDLDFFPARYYSRAQGRFITADPLLGSDAYHRNPSGDFSLILGHFSTVTREALGERAYNVSLRIARRVYRDGHSGAEPADYKAMASLFGILIKGRIDHQSAKRILLIARK